MTSTASPDSRPEPSPAPVALGWLVALFALGAGLQLWLWWRAVWIYWDQAGLYGQALDWLESGKLAGLGKPMTGDLRGPAGLLQILVGAPLLVWESLRASSLLIVLGHFAGGLLLLRPLSRLEGLRFAAAFLAICWLAPFRLYHGSFVWEPSYLFLPAAVHLWACAMLRPARDPGFATRWPAGPSLLLGLALAFAPQLHPSGVVLLVLTAFLLLGRSLAPSWPGLVIGLSLGVLPALPALSQVFREILTGESSGLTSSQFAWLPITGLLKGAIYWLRLPSADLGQRLTETSLCSGDEPGLIGNAACGFLSLLVAAAILTIAVSLVANVLYFRSREGDGEGPVESGRQWLRRYVGLALLALLAVCFIAPFRIQSWYTIAALPAASVPVAWWLSVVLGGGRRRRPLAWMMALFLTIRLAAVITVGVRHPMFVRPERPEMLWQSLPGELRFLVPGDGSR